MFLFYLRTITTVKRQAFFFNKNHITEFIYVSIDSAIATFTVEARAVEASLEISMVIIYLAFVTLLQMVFDVFWKLLFHKRRALYFYEV